MAKKQKQVDMKPKGNEAHWRIMMDQSRQYVGLLSLDGTLMEINRAALELVGTSAVAVLHRPFWETPWWSHSAALQKQLRAAIRTAAAGEPIRYEATHLAADGSLRQVDFSIHPVKDETGRVLFLVPEGNDITEQKRAEAALKESEERYRNFVRNATEGIYRIDFIPPVALDLPEQELIERLAQNAVVAEVNEHLARMYGLSPSEMIGRLATDFAPNYGERALLAVRADNFQVSDQETQDVDPAGRMVFLLENFTGVVEEGHLTHIWGMQRDITGQKRVEEALQLNTLRIKTLLEWNHMTGAGESELTHFAMEAAVHLTRSTIGYIAFMNEEETVLTMYAWSKQAMQECAIIDKSFVYPVATTGLWGEAVRQRRAVITNDYAAANPLKKGVPDGHVHVTRHMNVPVFDNDRIVIVAGVGNKPTDYGDDDVRQLTLLMSGMWTILRRRRVEEALRESEERFRSTFEQAAVGIVHVSPDGRFLRTNQRFCDIVGYTTDEILVLSFQDITYPPDLQADMDYVRELVEGRIPTYSMEKRYIRKDGLLVWINLTVALLRESDGQPKYFISVIEDIQKRKQAEETQARLVGILEGTSDLVATATPDRCITYMNRAGRAMVGWGDDVDIARHVIPDVHPEWAWKIISDVGVPAAIDKGIWVGESAILRVDGAEIPVSQIIIAHKSSQGELLYLSTVMRDITERKQAEETQLKLALVAQFSSELINLASLDGKMIFLNEAGCRMLGISPQDVKRHSIMEVIPEHIRAVVESELLLALMDKGHWEGDLQYRNLQSGELTDVHAMTFSIPDVKTGAPLFLANISLNITERKRAEEALREESERFVALARVSNTGVWEWHQATQYLWCSPEYFAMLGRDAADFDLSGQPNLEKTLLDLVHPDDRERTGKQFANYLAAGSPGMYENLFRMRHRDGSWVWIWSRGSTLRDANARLTDKTVGTHINITEQKLAEAEIIEQRERLQSIAANVPGMVYKFYALPTGEYGMSYVSERAVKLFELQGDIDTFFPEFVDHVHPDDREAFMASIREAVATVSPWRFEGRFVKPSGSILWFSGASDPTRLSDHIVFDGLLLDITDRKLAEEALREKEERLKKQNTALLTLVSRGTLFQTDLQQAVAEITEACSALIDTERVSVWLYSEDCTTIQCIDLYHQSDRRHGSGETLRSEEFPSYTASHRKGEVIAAVDVYSDPRTRDIPAAYYQEHDIRSLLDAPVWLHGRLGALLSFEHVGEKRAWTREDERLATNMATLLSLCFESNEHRRTAQALLVSEQSYHELFNASGDAFLVHDTNTGEILDVNRTMLDMFGITREEVIGRRIDVISEDISTYPEIAAQWRIRAAVEEGPQVFDWRCRRKDGQVFWASISLRNCTIAGQACVLASVRDITSRKQAEEALRESEEQFATVFREVPTVVGISTIAEGRYINVNEAFERVFGYTPEEVIGRTSADLRIFPDDFDRKIVLETIRTQGSIRNLELQLRAKNGSLRDCLLSAIMIHFQNKFCLLVVVNDITDRKNLEAQLNQAQKIDSVGRLAGGVAHDFNNMLGVILGHTEMALEQVGPDDPLRDELVEVRRAAERSADLTRQLLAFARKQTVAPKVLDLNETVAGTLKLLRRLIGEDIDLLWKPGHEVWPVRMDPAQLDQILANLCINARDAIAGVGKVIIETDNVTFEEDYCVRHAGPTPGDYVLLAVSDDGCGMDGETLSHIFEPFFTTKEMGKGTGLGLATVYGVVKQNNGFVNVYSEPGQGATFRIYLPRHAAEVAQEMAETKSQTVAHGSETILLVEDDPAILRMTKIALERLGYAVLVANNPREAIRLAEEHSGRIDLLMTDVVMPEMNGRDLAEKLLFLYPDIRRLFMSGYTADIIAHQGVLDKDVHFIQKPFSMKDLAEKIREVLDHE